MKRGCEIEIDLVATPWHQFPIVFHDEVQDDARLIRGEVFPLLTCTPLGWLIFCLLVFLELNSIKLIHSAHSAFYNTITLWTRPGSQGGG